MRKGGQEIVFIFDLILSLMLVIVGACVFIIGFKRWGGKNRWWQ
jgi:hypothetical protein